MADKVVRDILVANSAVTSLLAQRVSPLIKSQGQQYPAVTVTRAELTPTTHLLGDAQLDTNRVRVESWATTYELARQVATACRAALLAGGIELQTEFDNQESGVDPGLYCITQEYLVWT